MPNTARSVRCRKCHNSYDHSKHQRCPKCGAGSKQTATTPAVAGAPGVPPASKPKKERMTPIMKIASKGEGLVYGTPSISDPSPTRRQKKGGDNTPMIIGGVVAVALIVVVALVMGNKDDKQKKAGPPPVAPGSTAAAPTSPAPPADPGTYVDPAKMHAPPPPTPDPAATTGDPNEDPLDAEARGHRQTPAIPGPGPDGAPSKGPDGAPPKGPGGGTKPPDRAPAPPPAWKVDQAVKNELGPKLKEMNDWSTDKINAEKESLKRRGREVIPALIELVDNEDEMATKWACEILSDITHRNGFVMSTTREERKAISADWKAWYQEHGGTYDAAKERTEEQVLDQGIKWARKYKAVSSTEMQDSVAKEMCQLADKDVITGLIMVVGGDDKVLVPKADELLRKVTGQDMGAIPPSDDERKQIQGKWNAWWSANKATWQFPSK